MNSSAKIFMAESDADDQYFYFNEGVQSNINGKVLGFNGKVPETGVVVTSSNNTVTLALHNGTYCVTKSSNEPRVSISSLTAEQCTALNHVVAGPTDTWQTIADRTNVTKDELLAANNETNQNSTVIGRDIVAPVNVNDAVVTTIVEPTFAVRMDANIVAPTVTDANPGTLSGTGTLADKYLIDSAEDLVYLASTVNGGNNYSGKYFSLTKDLDFNSNNSYVNSSATIFGDINGNGSVEGLKTELTTGKGWNPIGTNAAPFAGNFSGNMNAILNLYINRPTTDYVGLFGKVTNPVNGLVLKNVNVTGNNYVGGLTGSIFGGTTGFIGDIEVSGSVTAMGNNAGLLAGSSYGFVNSVVVNGNVTGVNNVGGVVGTWDYTSGFASTINAAYFNGNLRGAILGGNITATAASPAVGRVFGAGYSSAAKPYLTALAASSVKVNGSTVTSVNLTSANGATYKSAADLYNINTQDAVLDTYIGGDNDGNGYYWDYDTNGALVRKNTTTDP